MGLNRSGLYYRPAGEGDENLALMRLLDEPYTRTPCYGVMRMTAYWRSLGHAANPKRVRRLLRTMGLEAVYQRPRTSQPDAGHKTYPYLLRGLPIDRCDQVWSTDITDVRLASGFVYLMAVIDWYSRYVLGWALSTTLDADFCIAAVGKLLEARQCEIFNKGFAVRSSPPRASPSRCWTGASGSAWTGAGGRWTTFSWNGSGARSSTSTSICRKSRPSRRHGRGCGNSSTSTTTGACTSRWTTGPPPRCILEGNTPAKQKKTVINPLLS